MKKYFSLFIFIILFIILGFYLKSNLDLIQSTFQITTGHLTRYFFIALSLVVASMFFIIKSYQKVFEMNGISKNPWKLLKLNLSGQAVNVIIPTAGLSHAVVYIEEARKRNESIHRTLNSVIMTYISDYTSICVFLIFSLIYLYFIDYKVVPYVWIPALIFILLTFSVYFLAFYAGKGSVRLEKIIKNIARVVEIPFRKLLKKKNVFQESVEKLYQEFKEVNRSILSDPKDWLLVIFYALLKHFCLIVSLYLILISFGINPPLRVVISAYSVGAALLVVSPTPSGIGFVEGGMYFIFTSLDVSAPIATSTIIIYRSITFWLPLFLGFFFYQRSKLRELANFK